jgi:5-methylcytosine-specific restriction endonuclease McrA
MTNPAYQSAVYRQNRRALLEVDRRCYRCGGYATTADHIRPLSAGGSHDLANLRPACRRCNSIGGAEITNERKAQRRIGRRSRRW